MRLELFHRDEDFKDSRVSYAARRSIRILASATLRQALPNLHPGVRP
jgi:hypothetical protein